LEAYGGTFQTGLEFLGGRHKPAFESYRVPIDLPVASISSGHSLRVWGLVRSAPRDTEQQVAIQFQAAGSTRFRTLKTVTTQRARAYVDARVRAPGSGSVRLAWTDPGGTHDTFYSRAAAVRVR
jgi:hypothetical protein